MNNACVKAVQVWKYQFIAAVISMAFKPCCKMFIMSFRELLDLNIPFTIIDHYETYIINCTSEDILKQSNVKIQKELYPMEYTAF